MFLFLLDFLQKFLYADPFRNFMINSSKNFCRYISWSSFKISFKKILTGCFRIYWRIASRVQPVLLFAISTDFFKRFFQKFFFGFLQESIQKFLKYSFSWNRCQSSWVLFSYSASLSGISRTVSIVWEICAIIYHLPVFLGIHTRIPPEITSDIFVQDFLQNFFFRISFINL